MLLALAFPALGMKISLPGSDSLSRSIPAVQAMDHVRSAFPSENAPAYVVVEAKDIKAPAVTRGIERFHARIAEHPDLFPGRPTSQIAPGRTLARISIPSAGSGSDETSSADALHAASHHAVDDRGNTRRNREHRRVRGADR